ncbi:putative SAM-dependent methyltransferase [Magnetospira sp. QH-2]|nr:putative SAM-dependent methyltransferase [Magnetospira sp. QH-2]
MTVFDRRAVRHHRDRAAPGFGEYDFLLAEVAERLLDRLDDVKRDFPVALDLGCHTGSLGKRIDGRGGIKTLVQADLSPAMAVRAGGLAMAADEEALPFAEGSFDLILSGLSLHWVNDLPGALLQIRKALKPDGLFLAAMFGGLTLAELRQSLAAAEQATAGGVSPRVSPFADVKDAGDLLARAGFTLPVVDTDPLTVSYGDPLKLMTDLRGMGESNAVIERRKSFSRRETLMAARQQYLDDFAGEDGRVPATFQVLFLLGWAPHPDQPQAAERGSGQVCLTDILE